MSHTRRVINLTTALAIGAFCIIMSIPRAMPAYGQGCAGDCGRQDVLNAQMSASIDREQSRVDDVARRVAKIEELKPDALVEHMHALDDRFADQQKLLWAIIVGIIVNLLTSTGKFPGRKAEVLQAVVEGITK